MQMLFDLPVLLVCISVILLGQFYYICLRMEVLKALDCLPLYLSPPSPLFLSKF